MNEDEATNLAESALDAVERMAEYEALKAWAEIEAYATASLSGDPELVKLNEAQKPLMKFLFVNGFKAGVMKGASTIVQAINATSQDMKEGQRAAVLN